jgi:hypothetical protein
MLAGDERPHLGFRIGAGPTFSARTRGTSLSISLSPTPPTATATDTAMQRSPAEPYAAPIKASVAWSRSASGITTMWFLAPPSACTRLPFCAAVA